MQRLKDWPERLNDTFSLWRDMPFEWGRADCALFAAACVEAMTGTVIFANWAGRYNTARGAAAELLKRGYRGLPAAATDQLGFAMRGYAARCGDVVSVEQQAGLCLGICTGTAIAVKAQEGLAFLPLDRAIEAWRV